MVAHNDVTGASVLGQLKLNGAVLVLVGVTDRIPDRLAHGDLDGADGALYPAWRAIRLVPIEALRRE
jgi:hypothetical protein